ncbi:unnamed protein product [Effrenium voratum]|nr:unnamed protein product [Effrenium voratum]
MRSPSPARRERPSIREPLQVVVRIRPLVGSAAESGAWRLEQRDGQHWVCHQPQGEKLERGVFPFDQCFDGKATNKELFDKAAKKLVQAAVAGSNASILAYGQTSSGKTHSVLGTPYEPGILPLAVEEIFGFRDDGLQVLGKQAKLSYFEIFNEKVIDLLAHGPSQEPRRLFQSRRMQAGASMCRACGKRLFAVPRTCCGSLHGVRSAGVMHGPDGTTTVAAPMPSSAFASRVQARHGRLPGARS